MDPFKPPADLVEAILARTSGSACESARERVCDLVDGRLESVDVRLMKLHLGSCESCSALVAAVARLSEELPALAELRLDDEFVAEVVARTSGRDRRFAQWAARAAESLRLWAGRPRFALEASYMGSCVLMLVFGIPGSPLSGVPGKALDLVRRNPIQEVQGPLAGLEQQVASGVHGLWAVTSDRVGNTSQQLVTHAGTLWDRFASAQENDDTNAAEDPPQRSDQGESK